MTSRRSALPGLLVLLAALAPTLAPAAVGAQSASEIMEDALDAYMERMKGVENYTVTQTVMGMESTVYFVREEMDGRATFVPDMSAMPGGMGEGADQSNMGRFDSNYFMRDEFIQRMRVDGSEEVDGNDTWVLSVDDFSGLDVNSFSGGTGSFEPSSMRMYMDKDDYLPRRMDMSGSTEIQGQTHEVSTTVLLMDYREVDGLVYPFRMEVATEGLGDAMGSAMGGMSEEDQARMDEMMADMEDQLADLPESQRAMVEKMMKGRMGEMMNQAMDNLVIETLRVAVNEGPPGGD